MELEEVLNEIQTSVMEEEKKEKEVDNYNFLMEYG